MAKLAYTGVKNYKDFNHCTPRLTLWFEQGYFSVFEEGKGITFIRSFGH